MAFVLDLRVARTQFGRIKGAAAARAAQVNKALVAFLACLMVALAATSVATNLARVSR